MNNKDFEKKPKKLIWIVSISLILILAVAIVAYFYLTNREPEKILKRKVEAFSTMLEKELNNEKNIRTEKLNLEITASVNSEEEEIREYLETLKLKTTTEVDLDKKILGVNVTTEYENSTLFSVDALIQNNEAYIYLNELYDKYIKVPDEYTEEIDFSEIFEELDNTVTEEQLKNIKEILLETIETKELTQETITEENDEKLLKTSIKLSIEDMQEILIKLLKRVDLTQEMDKNEINDLIETLEEEDLSEEKTFFEFTLYTKGIRNKVVRCTITGINEEEDEAFSIEIKNNDDISKIILYANENGTKIDDNFIIGTLTIKKIDKNNCETKLEITGLGEVINIKSNKKDENSGSVSININYDEVEATLNINYELFQNINIQERDITNSIDAYDLDDTDLETILENAKNNEELYSIIEGFLYPTYESYDNYNWDDEDYDWDDGRMIDDWDDDWIDDWDDEDYDWDYEYENYFYMTNQNVLY